MLEQMADWEPKNFSYIKGTSNLFDMTTQRHCKNFVGEAKLLYFRTIIDLLLPYNIRPSSVVWDTDGVPYLCLVTYPTHMTKS